MNYGKYISILQKLLIQVARYAGFSSYNGLYNGKMGIAILLYHGSRSLELPELNSVADSLIDDILDNVQQSDYGFREGLCGIAWGFHYLKLNGFVELESIFFDDLDDLLYENNALVLKSDLLHYPLTGLYIQTRLTNTPDDPFFKKQAMNYLSNMLTLPDIYNEIPFQLFPFLYCIWQWRYEKFCPGDIIEDVCRKFSYLDKLPVWNYQLSVLSKLYTNLCGKSYIFPLEKLTFSDINTLFFYKLLYQDMILPPRKLISDSFEPILADNNLIEELLLICNHRNQGLTQYIAGFTWSMFLYLFYCLPEIRKKNRRSCPNFLIISNSTPWTAAPPACVWWLNITAKATACNICATALSLLVKGFQCWASVRRPKTLDFAQRVFVLHGRSCGMRFPCPVLYTGNNGILW